ncbi:MAG: NAD(P)H-dependent oxidoreductase, partial [Chloroflexota bacterium]
GNWIKSVMSKVLIIFSHGDYQNSKVNRTMVEAIEEMDGITFNDLSAHYPDFQFDVAREQALLVEHDVVILQFPMYWYSSPALLKHWIDLVWLHKFAYGGGVYKLEGKTLAVAVSVGGSPEEFSHDGYYGMTLEECLRPFEMSARFTKMQYAPPFYLYDTYGRPQAELDAHAAAYFSWITQFID